jgi:hypothetical protein
MRHVQSNGSVANAIDAMKNINLRNMRILLLALGIFGILARAVMNFNTSYATNLTDEGAILSQVSLRRLLFA